MKYIIIAGALLTFSVTAAEQAVMSEVQIVGHSGGELIVESTGVVWGPDQVEHVCDPVTDLALEYAEQARAAELEVIELKARNERLRDIIWHLVINMDDDGEQK